MKITERNYEEYALDYIEGTLSEESRKAFDAFLQGHSGIAAEIRAIRDNMPVLVPDVSIRFGDKNTLKQTSLRRKWIIRAGVAAAVLILGIGFATYDRKTAETDFADLPQLAGNQDVSNPSVNPSAEELPEVSDAVVPERGSTPAEVIQPPVSKTPVSSQIANPRTLPTPQLILDDPLAKLLAVDRPVYPKLEEESILQTEKLDELAHALEQQMNHFEAVLSEPQLGAGQALEGGVVYITEELVIVTPSMPLDTKPSARNYFAENNEQIGFLNVLNRKGLRRVMAGILTPLSELNPIRVYENNDEKVVEFASIPISRRNTQQEQQ